MLFTRTFARREAGRGRFLILRQFHATLTYRHSYSIITLETTCKHSYETMLILLTTDYLNRYIAGNQNFIKSITSRRPDFFEKHAKGQTPEILWIGCADSRVPETTILDKDPGDIFVHRNIANIVQPEDLSVNSVIQFALTILKIKKIIVCGHTNCAGALTSLGDDDLGHVLNDWLQPLRELRRRHLWELDGYASRDEKGTRLAELNVKQGLSVLRQKNLIADAIKQDGLEVYGAIYDVGSGALRLLE